jgi:hypothetical protein
VKPYGVLTVKRVAVALAIGLSLVAGMSYLVGRFAGRVGAEGFDWELASIFGTALGTTLLAAVTGALAYTTSGDVRATWELARLTSRDQEARERPVVVLTSAVWNPDDQWVYAGEQDSVRGGAVVARVRNVGLGPALRLTVETSYADPAYEIEPAKGIVPALLPGEEAKITLAVEFKNVPPEGIRPDGFPIRGTFLDRSQHREDPIITAWERSRFLADGEEESERNADGAR